jgi:hypothetical protein
MNDTILKRFNEWNDRIRIARQDWDKAEKEYHNICYELRQLRGNNSSSGRGRGRSGRCTGKIRKGVLLLKDVDVDVDTRQKFREKELLKISLNRSLTQELWSSTATIIVRATNDGFISSIKQWTITNIEQTEQRNSNVVVNSNNNDKNDSNEITITKLMINQWDAITEKIDTIAESIAIDVQKRQNNDKIKVRKLDRLQETRKHFNNCVGNKRRKLLPQQPPLSSTTTTTTTTARRTTKTPLYRRSRKEVGALHARNECLAAMELHEAMRTVLSTLKIQQSNLLICRAVNRAIGSCCERLRSQQYRRRRRLRRRIVRQQQLVRILAADVAAAGRNNENENENENENNDNNEDNNINNGENANNDIDIVDNNNNNNIDENEGTNSSGNDNADSNGDGDNDNDNDNEAEKEQQKIDEEWNRKVEAAKVDSVYQWYRKNVGLLPV